MRQAMYAEFLDENAREVAERLADTEPRVRLFCNYVSWRGGDYIKVRDKYIRDMQNAGLKVEIVGKVFKIRSHACST